MSQVLDVKNLRVCFGDNCVVDDISFGVENGDYLMILGPNGAGKSVLMKAILGIIPYTGEVRFWVKNIRYSYGKVGYVPQYISADRNLPISVSEIIGLGLSNNEKDRIEELLDMVGMGGHGHMLLGTLSGGQLKRVLIAKALAKKPKLLLMDEPFAGVDMIGEKSVTQLLDDLRSKMNLTVVIISHDVSLVYKSATKVLCINKTRTCFGLPKDIHRKTIEATFGKGLRVHIH